MSDETIRVTGALPPEPVASPAPSEPPPSAQQIEVAMAQRAELLGDAEFRANAAKSSTSPQWQRLTALDRIIAAGREAEASPGAMKAAADEAVAEAKQAAATGEDEDGSAIPEGAFEPPESAGKYQLPTNEARRMGLDVDPKAEMDLRVALHGAGVDQFLANAMYTASLGAMKTDPDLNPVRVAADYAKASEALQAKWGKDFDANLKLANDEARRVFDLMPVSVRGEMSFAEYCLVSGLSNSRPIIELFHQRAAARARRLN